MIAVLKLIHEINFTTNHFSVAPFGLTDINLGKRKSILHNIVLE